jgi:Fic family protein
MDSNSLKDFLLSHKLMCSGLINDNGKLRLNNEGVFNARGKVVHLVPPPKMVPHLMDDLFYWLKVADVHFLIKSIVFHYELEFIHPFSDGNGRMGRLWQSLILSKFNPNFWLIPIDAIILERQSRYHKSILESNYLGNSDSFILFMLSIIEEALDRVIKD